MASAAPTPLKSFVPYDCKTCDFSIQNLPYGIFQTISKDGLHTNTCSTVTRVGVAIGDCVLDLEAVAKMSGINFSFNTSCFSSDSLNQFMALGPKVWAEVRAKVARVLSDNASDALSLRNEREWTAAMEPSESKYLVKMSDCAMLLPARIGDYTDFYSSREHATNVGTMFRGKDKALMPNWLTLPVGYHGRASSVVVSGTGIRRPHGQMQTDRTDPTKGSTFGVCKLMDMELEIGAFVGVGNALGSRIDVNKAAEEHLFGLVLMNDWSARDIQKWEYVPLGPFGGKNLGTTISPWVVPMAALKPFRKPTSVVKQTPTPHKYLQMDDYKSYDIQLQVALANPAWDNEPHVISKSNFRNMYWTVEQQLAHHSVTGCNMRSGDLLGSGTISGQTPDSYGSMLELAWKGTKPLTMPDKSQRKFIADGDEVIMTGYCQGDGYRVGFGECRGKILPAM